MQSDKHDDTPQAPPSGFVFHPGDTLEVSHDDTPTQQRNDLQPIPAAPIPATPAQTQTPTPDVPQVDQAVPAQPQSSPSEAQSRDDTVVTWTASEFIAHQKGFEWYITLGIGAVLLGALVYLFTQDYIAVVMIGVVAVALGIFAVKKPRVLQYSLDGSGLRIGQKYYMFSLFKSFSVIDDGAARSLLLMPMQRFAPSLTLYYSPEDEEKIVDHVAEYLPFENREQDALDRFMRRIRF